MRRFNSLAFKVPAILCIVKTILITILLIISLTIAGKGISKSRFEGFDNTVQAYAKLFDSILINQLSLAETYSVMPAVIDSVINRNDVSLRNLLNTLKQVNSELFQI